MKIKIVGHNKVTYTFTEYEISRCCLDAGFDDVENLLSSIDGIELIMSIIMPVLSDHSIEDVDSSVVPLMVNASANECIVVVTVEAMPVPFKIFDFDDNYCEDITIYEAESTARESKSCESSSFGETKKENEFCFMEFRKLCDVMYYISIIPLKLIKSKSSLYKTKSSYYLLCDFSNMDAASFDKCSMLAIESNSVIINNKITTSYIVEHGEMMIEERAIEKLHTAI